MGTAYHHVDRANVREVGVSASRLHRRSLRRPEVPDAHLKHPALVVRHGASKATTATSYTMRELEGTESHTSITVLSLERHRATPTVFSISVRDHDPSGVGQDTKPKPTEPRDLFEHDHHVASALVASHGCH